MGKWTNKIPNLTWTFTAFSTSSHFVESLWITCYKSCSNGCELHSHFMDSIITSFNLFDGNQCRIQGHPVPYRSLTAESWESVETFFSFGDRNRNVHEWKRLNLVTVCDWHLALPCDISHQLHDLNTNFKVYRNSFLICLGLLRHLKSSWSYFGNTWKTVTSAIFLPVICFTRMAVCVPFPSVQVVEIIDSLVKNLKKKIQ